MSQRFSGTATPYALPADTSTPSATQTPGLTATATPRASDTATAQAPAPTDTTVPASQTGHLVSVSVRPLTVAAGGRLTASITTAGTVQKAEMYVGSGAPNAPAPETIPLSQISSGAWSGTGPAPGVAGTYHFTVGLYGASGRRSVIDNDSWNIQVQGGTPAGSGSGTGGAQSGAQPLYADIPLAPPFSYGSPVSAVFNAGGKTVNGSEVVSNARPDVSAATVGQFYAVHFPRSGWATDGTTVPAGATSFSMSATSGARVCIVQYSAGVVHIFYGSASG
ncbi:MAG TPA: hypothetical protein VF221_18625 [Chloroflexota bacterium]